MARKESLPMSNRNLMCSMLIASLALTGCARYEYDLVNPPDLARHIGGKADEVVRGPAG
jgi:hypothetical protein